jgi:hypothetical protein
MTGTAVCDNRIVMMMTSASQALMTGAARWLPDDARRAMQVTCHGGTPVRHTGSGGFDSRHLLDAWTTTHMPL